MHLLSATVTAMSTMMSNPVMNIIIHAIFCASVSCMVAKNMSGCAAMCVFQTHVTFVCATMYVSIVSMICIQFCSLILFCGIIYIYVLLC